MNRIKIQQFIEGFRMPLVVFGALLIGTGGFLLLYVGMLVVQVINSPEKVRIVEFVLSHVQIDDKAISGKLGDKIFEITMSESIRIVIFVFLGVLILSVLAKIVRTLISGGIDIIRLALKEIQIDVVDKQSNKSLNQDK